MNGDFILLGTVAALTLLLVLSRTHVAIVTLAVFAGFVLSDVTARLLFDAVSEHVDQPGWPIYNIIRIALLVIPALLVCWRLGGSQKGPTRFIEQLIPAMALSMLLVVFALDSVPQNVINELKDGSYVYGQIPTYRPWLVVFAIATALFDVVIQNAANFKHRGPGRPKKHH